MRRDGPLTLRDFDEARRAVLRLQAIQGSDAGDCERRLRKLDEARDHFVKYEAACSLGRLEEACDHLVRCRFALCEAMSPPDELPRHEEQPSSHLEVIRQ